jgi:hypothetical protein
MAYSALGVVHFNLGQVSLASENLKSPCDIREPVHLWLERYIFPICVAIVFGLTILNPLRLDWRQRISLAIAVSAFAYFLAHTIHKPSSTPTQPDPRVSFLEQKVQNLESQQQQIAAQEASKEKERRRRQEVKKELAAFLKEGQRIQNGIEYNNQALLHDKARWERQVEGYLAKNLDESYAVRFRSPSHQTTVYPLGINREMMTAWGPGDRTDGDAQRLHLRTPRLE